jgi:hypothetical protein
MAGRGILALDAFCTISVLLNFPSESRADIDIKYVKSCEARALIFFKGIKYCYLL